MTTEPCVSSTSTLPLAPFRPLEQPPISLLTKILPFAAYLVEVFPPHTSKILRVMRKVLFSKFLVFQRNILTLHSTSLAKNIFCVHSFNVDDKF